MSYCKCGVGEGGDVEGERATKKVNHLIHFCFEIRFPDGADFLKTRVKKISWNCPFQSTKQCCYKLLLLSELFA
jgi:hypothetical protein